MSTIPTPQRQLDSLEMECLLILTVTAVVALAATAYCAFEVLSFLAKLP